MQTRAIRPGYPLIVERNKTLAVLRGCRNSEIGIEEEMGQCIPHVRHSNT